MEGFYEHTSGGLVQSSTPSLQDERFVIAPANISNKILLTLKLSRHAVGRLTDVVRYGGVVRVEGVMK